MANPLTPDVLVDPVELTRALVDVESVSRNEQALADHVEEVLRRTSHLRVERLGNTVMARTDLGRDQRVVLAVSELVSSVVAHTTTSPVVELTRSPTLIIAVDDAGDDDRGMAVVAACSDRWGATSASCSPATSTPCR